MRILMLNDYGSPDGGAERQMLRLRDGLRARGHAVRLLASDAPLPGVTAAEQTPNAADYGCRGSHGRLQVLTSVHNFSAARALRRALHAFRPDVVHVRMFLWQLSPAVLPLLRGVPTLYHVAQYKAVCPTGQKRLPDGRACNVVAGRVCHREGCVSALAWGPAMTQLARLRRHLHAIDRVVVLSNAMRDVLHSGGFDRACEVVHNGVPERAARPPLGGPPTVGFAGRLVAEKGVDILIDALAAARRSVRDARLLVLGDGPHRAALERRAAGVLPADAVTFTGHLPRSTMERALDGVWVQATPSQWQEPFGNVSLEAMMRGTAVLASRVGGQQEIVDDHVTGHLLPPGDTAAWGARMAELLADRDRAEAYGAAGRRRAHQDFSETVVQDRFTAIYREMIHHA